MICHWEYSRPLAIKWAEKKPWGMREKRVKVSFLCTGQQVIIRYQQLWDAIGLYGVFLHARIMTISPGQRGIVVSRKI